jgi:hypothetical protein
MGYVLGLFYMLEYCIVRIILLVLEGLWLAVIYILNNFIPLSHNQS